MSTDEGIGLSQLGARSYDASLGRFLLVDPLVDQADSQQMHGYSYARNSPVTYADADGLHPCACFGKGIGKSPGKSPGPSTGSPSTGSAIGTTIPGGGGGGGGGGGFIGGWGPSGGGSSSGPTGVTPEPPYVEIDYVDPEEVALGEAEHGHENAPGSVPIQADVPTPFTDRCLMNPVQCWITEPLVETFSGFGQWIQEGITGIISWITEQWNRLPGYVQSLIITVVAITASAAAVSLLGTGLLSMADVAIIGGLANIWRYVSSTEKKKGVPLDM